ncbi:hypothetical protein U1Q18_015007 [Sarracenia purpurea var. burkii]
MEAQVLYRLALVFGRQTSQTFSLDAAKRTAIQLEAEGKDDLDFSVNILVLEKSGVDKSATINSIFGEEKSSIDAFEPSITTVKEISGIVNGVKIKVCDTPGLKSAENGSAAHVSTPLPDMVLPPSFDSDSSTYRYRFLEPTSVAAARRQGGEL